MCAQLTAAAQSLSQPLLSLSTKGRERALQSRAQSSQVDDRGTRAWSSPLSDRPPQRGKNCPLCHSRMPFNARLRFFTCSDHMSRGEQAHLPRNHSRGSRETVPSQEGNPPLNPGGSLFQGISEQKSLLSSGGQYSCRHTSVSINRRTEYETTSHRLDKGKHSKKASVGHRVESGNSLDCPCVGKSYNRTAEFLASLGKVNGSIRSPYESQC